MKPKLSFLKIALMLFLAIFLYLFYRFTENGRFQQAPGSPYIIDSRTGEVVKDVRKK